MSWTALVGLRSRHLELSLSALLVGPGQRQSLIRRRSASRQDTGADGAVVLGVLAQARGISLGARGGGDGFLVAWFGALGETSDKRVVGLGVDGRGGEEEGDGGEELHDCD